jgi:hypothetical protein
VAPHGACASRKSIGRPGFEVADIFRAHGVAYRATHRLTEEQRRAMWAIEACRTAVLGGHVQECPDCGRAEDPAYNSCRNRHCPKCQGLAQAQWLEKRCERIIPTHYFHVVFTLPGEVGGLGIPNRRLVYDLLFAAASDTLLTLGRDEKRLAATLGVTAVLHTWTRDLRFHPHLHCIVTGGGLALEGERWVDAGRKHLFPVRVLSRLFRGKFLDALGKAAADGRLALPERLAGPKAFARWRRRLYEKEWVVYAKRPFAGPEAVFAYVGRYTHRVGLSNHRILAVDADSVRIATRGGKSVSMPPLEFIRRFLQHVVPKGFVKIRHYGLMAASNVKTKLAVARRLLKERADAPVVRSAVAPPTPGEPAADWRELMRRLTGVDLRVCPHCGGSRRQAVILGPATAAISARGPPGGVP